MAVPDTYLFKLDPFDIKSIGHFKETHFTHQLIYDYRAFEEWYNSVERNSKRLIYRGVNEAKHKQFTSLQRVWWNSDFARGLFGDIHDSRKYYSLLNTLMQKARTWNNKLLEKYFSNFNVKLNDFALLSLMQHYGLPTPLLDFTYDLDIALYFAFDRMSSATSNRIIENCVSLYIIDLDENQNRITELSNLTEFQEDLPPMKQILELKKLIVFSEFTKNLDDGKNVTRPLISSNLNIINQKGLFLLNYHHWLPIEANSTQFKGLPLLENVICIDIHKSLKQFILAKLVKENPHLNQAYLFPSFSEFRESTLNSAFTSIQEFM